MPGKNSYTYYDRFFKCLRRYLEKKAEEQKKEKWLDKPELLRKWDEGPGRGKFYEMDVETVYAAFKLVIDVLFEKAPSACMGADDWLDQFFIKADGVLCQQF